MSRCERPVGLDRDDIPPGGHRSAPLPPTDGDVMSAASPTEMNSESASSAPTWIDIMSFDASTPKGSFPATAPAEGIIDLMSGATETAAAARRSRPGRDKSQLRLVHPGEINASSSELTVCLRRITPAILDAGWSPDQIEMNYTIGPGRISLRSGKPVRLKPTYADYALFYRPGVPLAVVEAKKSVYSISHGLQQSIGYAEILGAPYAFASNGKGFSLRDRITGEETQFGLDDFPSPEDLWQRFCLARNLMAEDAQRLVLADFNDDGSGLRPRSFQIGAINAAVQAIARGQKRMMMVMATGTGKTITAMQIIWRLRRANPNLRVLFLADRNALVDQTMVKDFRHFGTEMAKLSSKNLTRGCSVSLALYQTLTSTTGGMRNFEHYDADYFDVIIIDECHRGSAREDTEWREILDHFSPAIHVGLTATPNSADGASNFAYFGSPIYSYSLSRGIEDGWLAPYRIIRVDSNIDTDGWRPAIGQRDENGEFVEDRHYDRRDFDRKIVLRDRVRFVARRITEYLKASGDRMQKTIVLCEDQEHALMMRDELARLNADMIALHPNYVMRITSDDKAGCMELANFIEPSEPTPVIAVSAQMLTTGVDTKTTKLIVIDQTIASPSLYKQIKGRGTRIEEKYGKLFFTILDFRGATRVFEDPNFDGGPEAESELGSEDPFPIFEGLLEGAGEGLDGDGQNGDDLIWDPVDDMGLDLELDPRTQPRIKPVVDGVFVALRDQEIIYFDADGRPQTESLAFRAERVMGELFGDCAGFRSAWLASTARQDILDRIEASGVPVQEIVVTQGANYDVFDLLAHIGFAEPMLLRADRAAQALASQVITDASPIGAGVLKEIVGQYAGSLLLDLARIDILKVPPFSNIGARIEILQAFGDQTGSGYRAAVSAIEQDLYRKAV